MTTAAVVYGIAVATVGGILAALAHRDLTRARVRAQLNADTLAHIRWLDVDDAYRRRVAVFGTEDEAEWEQELGWVR